MFNLADGDTGDMESQTLSLPAPFLAPHLQAPGVIPPQFWEDTEKCTSDHCEKLHADRSLRSQEMRKWTKKESNSKL